MVLKESPYYFANCFNKCWLYFIPKPSSLKMMDLLIAQMEILLRLWLSGCGSHCPCVYALACTFFAWLMLNNVFFKNYQSWTVSALNTVNGKFMDGRVFIWLVHSKNLQLSRLWNLVDLWLIRISGQIERILSKKKIQFNIIFKRLYHLWPLHINR